MSQHYPFEREAHTSPLIESGFSPLTIANIPEHEKVKNTRTTYSHLFLHKHDEAAVKLQNCFCIIGQKKKPISLVFIKDFGFICIIPVLLCKVVLWCNVLILVVEIREFCPDCTYCVDF